jgi:hypothetical protein
MKNWTTPFTLRTKNDNRHFNVNHWILYRLSGWNNYCKNGSVKMGDMCCGKCYRFGIYWIGLGTGNPHTYCPNCGGVNCQQAEEPEEEEQENV